MNAFNHEIGREAAAPAAALFVFRGRIPLADHLARPAWRDERAMPIEGLGAALSGWIVERFRWSKRANPGAWPAVADRPRAIGRH